jgi:hypothetical protein
MKKTPKPTNRAKIMEKKAAIESDQVSDLNLLLESSYMYTLLENKPVTINCSTDLGWKSLTIKRVAEIFAESGEWIVSNTESLITLKLK